MKTLPMAMAVLLAATVSACVTINIYFFNLVRILIRHANYITD